jgi:hypothetical protein
LAKQDYQAVLKRSQGLATGGQFQDAIDLLEPLQRQFFQPDGKAFLETLYEIVEARKSFHLGLHAERAEDWHIARHCYQSAMTLSSYWKTECQVRLAWVAIKTAQWSEGLSYLEHIQTEQAAALREICHAQLDKPQPVVQKPQPIEHPRLEIEVWQQHDWQEIVDVTEECWLTHQNNLTLHNWAIATYYRSLNTGHYWDECIIALSTALANLHQDPALQSISWSATQSVDLSEVCTQLRQHLEELVHGLEDTNRAEWDQIHLLHRLEATSLDLMGYPPTDGVQVEGIFLTPGCYQRYRHRFRVPPFRGHLIWTLYTDWWQAVLACRDGNTFQAIQLRPKQEPISEAERFAQALVLYYEGCYYLQIQPGGYLRWRSAMAPLRQAKSAIRLTPEWFNQLDRLCETYSNAIWHTSDRYDFVQFWYELVESRMAKHHFNQLDR